MIQCICEGKRIFLVKHETLTSDLSEEIVDTANYRIRRRHADVLRDIRERIERVKFPDVKKNTSFEDLEDAIFSVKRGYPLEFKDKDIPAIRDKALSIRNQLSNAYFSTKHGNSDNLQSKLKEYCDFLAEHCTNDCVILSLKNLRVLNGDHFTRYDFKQTMDTVSDNVNRYQHAIRCKFLMNFINRERRILNDMSRSFVGSKLVEFMFAITDKLAFSSALSTKTNAMSSWKENMKTLSFVLYEDIHNIKFKIDKVRNVEEAKKMAQTLARTPRKNHATFDSDKIAYDFDFVLHLGSDDKFTTLESLTPNLLLIEKIKNEIDNKKVYVVTHNVEAHEDGFLSAFLNKWVGDAHEKITILSTQNGKSETILEHGISTFYDDKESVLQEVSQNVKIIRGFEDLRLFIVVKGKPEGFFADVQNPTWFDLVDERVSVEAQWYIEGDKYTNNEPCAGCSKNSKNYCDHTFDKQCTVTCKACKFQRHDTHSTYTRKFCLPSVRQNQNSTILPDWSYYHLIKMLDDKMATFKIVDKYMKIYGDCDPYVAKYVLCSSPIKAVQVYYHGNVKVYSANTISTSLSLVTDALSINRAIANCKIGECKVYPEF